MASDRGSQARVGRVVCVHLDQPRYLFVGVPHQRQEREHQAADARQRHQPVVVTGQVSPLVCQHGVQLAGIERLHRAGGHDHRRVPAGDAVRMGLGMFHQHGPQGRLGMAGQPGGLGMPHRLPPGGAKVSQRGDRGPGHDSASQDEAEPGHGAPPGVP